MSPTKKKTIAIIGGGASGIFASIRCAEIAKEKILMLIFASLKQPQVF